MRHFLGLRGSAAFKISSTDVTPNAISWADVFSSCATATSSTQTITGINTTITFSISYTRSGATSYTFQYLKNGVATTITTSPTNISLSNNDTLAFILNRPVSSIYPIGSVAITVRNASDGNALIDTLNLSTECDI